MTQVRDDYTWRAVYTDGSALEEVDRTGEQVRGFRDIDLARLAAFEILPRPPLEHDARNLQPVRLLLPAGARLIFFRRRSMALALVQVVEGVVQSNTLTTVHVLGWQATVRGKNVKVLLAVYPNGSVLLTDDDDAITSGEQGD